MSDEVRFVAGALATAGGILLSPIVPPIGGALIMLGTGQMRQALFPNRMDNERQWQNIQATIADLPVVYGETRVGARIADSRIADLHRMYRVYCFALGSENGKGIESVEGVWLDDPDAHGLGIASPTVGQGPTETGVNQRYNPGGDGMQLAYSLHLGSDTQVVDSMMNAVDPTAWPATSKGVGVAYMVLRLNNHEVFNRVPNVTALVRGARVYDPRFPTNGPDSDGYVWDKADTDASITEHPGQNPTLQILDYLMSDRYGIGAPLSEILAADFIVEANYDDAAVQDGDVGTQARFKSDGWISTADQLGSNIDALLSAKRAELVFEQGLWRLHTRKVATATTFKLNEDNIIGGWEFSRAGSAETPNRIVARFPWDDNEYKTTEAEWPKYATDPNPYMTVDADIEQLVEIDLPMTTDWVRTEQIAMVMLKTVREDTGVKVTADPTALQLRFGDVVPVSHRTPGWTDKEMEVRRVDLLPDGNARLTLAEHDDAAYSLDAQVLPPSAPGSDLADPTTVIAPTALVLTSDDTTLVDNGDGSFSQYVKATWARSTDPFLKFERVEYEIGVSGVKIPWHEVWPPDTTEVTIGPVEPGLRVDVYVFAVNTRSVESTALSDNITPGQNTDPATSPIALSAGRTVDGSWRFRWWTAAVDRDTLSYELRYNPLVETASWDDGVKFWDGNVRGHTIDWSELPIIPLRVMVKAISRAGVWSTGYASANIVNGPPNVSDVDYMRDQTRRRKADVAEGKYGGDLVDGTGLITRVNAETGEIEEVYYHEGGPDLNLRTPVQQGSQVNTETNVYQRYHQQTITVATGAQVVRVRHLSGGLSVQGAAKWGTKAQVDADTAATAAPATYHRQPTFDIDTVVVTPQLYLASSTTLTNKSAAFTPDNTATSEGDVTDNSVPATGDVPAWNDIYSCYYELSVIHNKSGSYSVTLALEVQLNGAGLWKTIDTAVHVATFGVGGGSQLFEGSLSGSRTGLAGGDDNFRVEVVETDPIPNTAEVTVEQLTWQTSTSDYASMTPNDELCDIEVVTIPPG